MRDGGDVEAQKLFIAHGTEKERVVLYDTSGLRWGSISENERDRKGFRLKWQLVVLREFGINKTTLTTAVYHCSS